MTFDESQEEQDILEHYRRVLRDHHLNEDEILATRQAIIRITDQILDFYFDNLNEVE